MHRKTIRLLLFIQLLSLITFGQDKQLTYYPATDFGIRGQAKEIASQGFTRIDSVYHKNLSESLQNLSKNTAGLYVEFQTNSSFIDLKWELETYKVLPNMTPLAVNGFDLYGLKDNRWQYVASAPPRGQTNKVCVIKNLRSSSQRFRLYFPLYSQVKTLLIGIDEKADIAATELIEARPKILIYGSSITQGASASRPGMAFASILGRSLDAEVYNFGFSGSGKMESEMAEILQKVKADVIILDCVPNPSPEQISQRTIPFVELLRKRQHNVPILMVESVFREAGNWDEKLGQRVRDQNNTFHNSYEQLLKKGYVQLYYIESDQLIGSDHQATTDGVHFSDLGHYRMAKTLEKQLRTILHTTK